MCQQHGLFQQTNPVVIGGIGGSGTRLIAQCLRESGFYLGPDLNDANDNLWFTLLFKRNEIMAAAEEEFDELLRIFVGRMTGRSDFTKHQIQMIKSLAAKDRDQHPAWWLRQREESLLNDAGEFIAGARWGWKEPNAHMVLDRLANRLQGMKYVHVVRNGLDMAHSRNQNQLRLWGHHFLTTPFNVTPFFSLKFWCAVHERVLRIGESMSGRFLLLNYDQFCVNPIDGTTRLLEFLGLQIDALQPQLVALIKPPASIGRFKNYGTRIFAEDNIGFVKSLGFDVSAKRA